jgi:glucose-6-phosphate 1-dehydrogenase
MASTAAGGAGAGAPAAESGAGGVDMDAALTIVVLGASGDLAHKKTYPALFDLFVEGLLPPQTRVYGYARSSAPDDKHRAAIRAGLKSGTAEQADAFLAACFYRSGGYDDPAALGKVRQGSSSPRCPPRSSSSARRTVRRWSVRSARN